MKRIIAIASLLALCFTASAQQYSLGKLLGNYTTNNVANNTTATSGNGIGTVATVTRYSEIAVQPVFALTDAGTTACTFNFVSSVDGTNWPATAQFVLTCAPAGTATVSTNKSWDVGAAGYVKVLSITAANNSAAMTNIQVYYSRKPDRFDK